MPSSDSPANKAEPLSTQQHLISSVGMSLVDHIMLVDGFKTGEGSYHSEDYFIEGGGMAATALCAASKLGATTRLFSRVGDDVNGNLIIDGLIRYGVDTENVRRMPDCMSTSCFVLVDTNTGEKQFFSQWIKPPFEGPLDIDVEKLEGTDVLLLDGHWTEGALQAARWASGRRIPIVADFKRMYTGLEALFPYIDYFIVPDFFAEELAGSGPIEQMLERLRDIQAGIPVITMGAKGGAYLWDGGLRRYPVFPIDNIDSTGAGDAFHGAFCTFLAEGLDVHQCLETASAVGALNCRAFGGRWGLPSREELIRFLEENEGRISE